ncbi:MAG: hypothetical protein ACXWP4_13240 [Polyangiales bacterium]
MRALLSISLVLPLLACGSSPSPPPPKTAAKTAAPPKPRCPPGAEEMPTDAKPKMASLQAEVRRCWTLGTPGKSESTVKVEVTVAESGAVREAKVIGDGDPSAVQCMVKSLKSAKFSSFCGPDVAIAWTYALR